MPALDRSERLIVALDVSTERSARLLTKRVMPHAGLVKVGLQLFTAIGPRGVSALNAPFVLDLKLHDIPETVANAVFAALPLSPRILTVHAAGGEKMIKMARRASEEAGSDRPLVFAIILLSHLEQADLDQLSWMTLSRDRLVRRLAIFAVDSGADGLVCAATDAQQLRSVLGPTAKLMCLGIRGEKEEKHDHARTASPSEAVRAGADFIVVGRPVRDAPKPARAAARIALELNEAEISGGTDAGGHSV